MGCLSQTRSLPAVDRQSKNAASRKCGLDVSRQEHDQHRSSHSAGIHETSSPAARVELHVNRPADSSRRRHEGWSDLLNFITIRRDYLRFQIGSKIGIRVRTACFR
jgi:hypothetical protein